MAATARSTWLPERKLLAGQLARPEDLRGHGKLHRPNGSPPPDLGTKNLFYRPINLFGAELDGELDVRQHRLPQERGSGQLFRERAIAHRCGRRPREVPGESLLLLSAGRWQATERLLVTGGIRVEKPQFLDKPPENPSVLANYGRSTSAVPSRATISPRFSFNWDATGDQRNQVRGGLGYFAGTPPFVYLSNAFGNSGLSGYASLTCGGNAGNQGTNATSTIPPAFNAGEHRHSAHVMRSVPACDGGPSSRCNDCGQLQHRYHRSELPLPAVPEDYDGIRSPLRQRTRRHP